MPLSRFLRNAGGAMALAVLVPSTQAAVFTTHSTFAAFSAATGGLVSEDFSGYAAGDNLDGVEFIPGVSATTNAAPLEVFGANKSMFALGNRAAGDLYYDISLGLPYTAIGFDIRGFEADPLVDSKADGPGKLTVEFADSTSTMLDIFGNQAGLPVFFGITSDTAISSVRWAEALEGNGGNEETTLDDFYVSRVTVTDVPEPATAALLGLALAGLGASRRKQYLSPVD